MQKNFFLVGIVVCSVLLSGCSFFNRGYQIVTVTVDPEDATVIANGVEYHNRSPQFIETRTGREFLLSVYKPGYKETLYVVDYQLSSTGKIDAWGSFWIFPIFGLFSNGAWELKENNIKIKLEALPQETVIEDTKAKAAEERKKILEEINHEPPVLPAIAPAVTPESTPAVTPAATPVVVPPAKPVLESPVVSVSSIPSESVEVSNNPALIPAKALKAAKAAKAKDNNQQTQETAPAISPVPAAHAADAAAIMSSQQ